MHKIVWGSVSVIRCLGGFARKYLDIGSESYRKYKDRVMKKRRKDLELLGFLIDS